MPTSQIGTERNSFNYSLNPGKFLVVYALHHVILNVFLNHVKPIFKTLMITVVVKMCQRLSPVLLDLPIFLIEQSRETLSLLKFKYFILT